VLRLTKLVPFSLILVSALAAADRTPSDQFYEAIRSNDLPAVRLLLKSGTPIDTKDARGGTPLHYAAAVGSIEMVRELLAAGAGVNARTSFEATPLMWCAGDLAKTKLLVEKGADVNARSKMGNTPLQIAAAEPRNVETIRYLLEHGAEMGKARNEMGMTPLMRAALGNDAAAVRLLLEKGGDPNIADGGGNTPLMYAAGNGNVEAVKLLIAKGADVNAQSQPSFGPGVKNGPIAIGRLTPLILAASSRSPETVRTLLDAGAKVDVTDVRGMTPLMLAVATDHADESIVRTLLAKHPALDVKSKSGETALVWAAKFQHASILPAVRSASEGMEVPKAAPMTAEKTQNKDPRIAAEKAIALMQKTNRTFLKNGGCFSCHAQNITSMATGVARSKGILFDQAAAAETLRGTELGFASQIDGLLERSDLPVSLINSISLLGMGYGGFPASRTTDALAMNLAAQQCPDGGWVASGGISRPPTADHDFSSTAYAIYALKHYAPPAQKAEAAQRIAKAGAWLLHQKPVTTEDYVMQLLGAKWAGVDTEAIDKLARHVLALQREDGGWAQTAALQSDAYATGSALFALREAGHPAKDAAIGRGIQFLLETQAADGSWHVCSRAPKFQPYFESGFPYGHDQWISQWATGWAALALSL
jgi:ankyrin repeat protein